MGARQGGSAPSQSEAGGTGRGTGRESGVSSPIHTFPKNTMARAKRPLAIFFSQNTTASGGAFGPLARLRRRPYPGKCGLAWGTFPLLAGTPGCPVSWGPSDRGFAGAFGL